MAEAAEGLRREVEFWLTYNNNKSIRRLLEVNRNEYQGTVR